MGTDNVLSVIRRYSDMVDTSGQYPPPGIQMVPRMAAGVYTQTTDTATSDDIFHGRLSLGILAAFVLGALAFYLWTHDIQGGG